MEYDNAGTVEFLLDQEGRYYFIEMNPRIQVEHTVTEQITAIDIVRNTDRHCRRQALEIRQKDGDLAGHAIQCRINAEDPRTTSPCTGTVTAYLSPCGSGSASMAPSIRITPFFLTTRPVGEAHRPWSDVERKPLSRMRRALEEYVLRGVETTIPFMKSIMQDPDFLADGSTPLPGDASRHFHYDEFEPGILGPALSAAIAAYEGL